MSEWQLCAERTSAQHLVYLFIIRLSITDDIIL